ncbi:hypothetical protein C0214_21465 [Methylobacterium sp. DM1]|nr:hypothetical protein C0214_21465 [Methylobacterium sp. DM1]
MPETGWPGLRPEVEPDSAPAPSGVPASRVRTASEVETFGFALPSARIVSSIAVACGSAGKAAGRSPQSGPP